MGRHVNIPIFIPHIGCPNLCVFCNQRTISGVREFDPEALPEIIERALSTVEEDAECEIAFFGGSFTGIDEGLMIRLLEIAHRYIEAGRVTSIRCSTRPDYISPRILDILWSYGVRTVELGLQSISDRVLSASGRGHTSLDEIRAVKLITERGFSLVGQMMIGLPGATPEDELATAEFIIASGADAARIYPTVVFHDTALCHMAECGEYKPLSTEDAISRSLPALRAFARAGVRVIRIGLSASENLSGEAYYAGPNDAALGEMIISEFYYENIRQSIDKLCLKDEGKDLFLTVHVSRGATSRAVGHRRKNINRLTDEYGFWRIAVREDDTLTEYGLRVSVERKKICT